MAKYVDKQFVSVDAMIEFLNRKKIDNEEIVKIFRDSGFLHLIYLEYGNYDVD